MKLTVSCLSSYFKINRNGCIKIQHSVSKLISQGFLFLHGIHLKFINIKLLKPQPSLQVLSWPILFISCQYRLNWGKKTKKQLPDKVETCEHNTSYISGQMVAKIFKGGPNLTLGEWVGQHSHVKGGSCTTVTVFWIGHMLVNTQFRSRLTWFEQQQEREGGQTAEFHLVHVCWSTSTCARAAKLRWLVTGKLHSTPQRRHFKWRVAWLKKKNNKRSAPCYQHALTTCGYYEVRDILRNQSGAELQCVTAERRRMSAAARN